MDKTNEFEYGDVDLSGPDVQGGQIIFPVEANIHYRCDLDGDSLLANKPRMLGYLQNHVEFQVPRLSVLDDYYKGRNVIILGRERKEKEKANHRAAHNFGKLFTQFDVGYNTGNPIKLVVDDEGEFEEVKKFNETNEIDAHNTEMWLDVSKYGRAYELMHRTNNDETKVYLSNAFETFVIYDNTIERKPVMAVRYTKDLANQEQNIFVTAYTDDWVVTYEPTSVFAFNLIESERKPNPFGRVPIVEYTSNRFRQGLYEDVLTLIDLYDASQSDTANYMSDLNEAMLVIKTDMDLSNPDEVNGFKQMKEVNTLVLSNETDATGKTKTQTDAYYLYKQYDVAGTEAYKARVERDLHKIANVPNLSDINFSGTQSGEAMKYKLLGFEQYAISRQRLFVKSANERYELLYMINNKLKPNQAVKKPDISYIFTPNLPQLIAEQLDMLVKAGAEFSQETLYNQATFIENANEEIERVGKEKVENIRSYDVFEKKADVNE